MSVLIQRRASLQRSRHTLAPTVCEACGDAQLWLVLPRSGCRGDVVAGSLVCVFGDTGLD